MKSIKPMIAVHLVLWGSLVLLIYKAKSELEVSATVQINAPADFYQPLAADGSWVDVGGYGRCFRPARVDADWRPYCEGSWVWTDCGWYWESDEPWAWACYHYGTWFDDPVQGWVWLPGIEWAPAWVVWRTGGDYIGWAPCAPRGVTVAPALFGFVEVNHFQDPIRRESIRVNNASAISQTRVMAGPSRENRSFNGKTQEVVINHGPDLETIQKATGKQLKAVPIQDVSREQGAPHDLVPAVQKGQAVTPKEPAGTGKEKHPPNEIKEQVLPGQTARPQSGKPSNIPQPAIEHPATPPKQEGVTRDRVLPGRAQQPPSEAPAENAVPPVERRERPPAQNAPAAPPRQEKRANPPQEEKPSNAPQKQDKKDSQNKSPRMLADLCYEPPLGAGTR